MEFCRICDNYNVKSGTCKVKGIGYGTQLAFAARGRCVFGKVEGTSVKFIYPNFVETTDRKYSRRSSETGDTALRNAFRTGNGLEKLEMPFAALRLSGRSYR